MQSKIKRKKKYTVKSKIACMYLKNQFVYSKFMSSEIKYDKTAVKVIEKLIFMVQCLLMQNYIREGYRDKGGMSLCRCVLGDRYWGPFMGRQF